MLAVSRELAQVDSPEEVPRRIPPQRLRPFGPRSGWQCTGTRHGMERTAMNRGTMAGASPPQENAMRLKDVSVMFAIGLAMLLSTAGCSGKVKFTSRSL